MNPVPVTPIVTALVCLAIVIFPGGEKRSLLAPGRFFAMIWTWLLAALGLFTPDYLFPPAGGAAIVTACLFLSCGSFAGGTGRSKSGSLPGIRGIALRTACAAGTLLGAGAVMSYIAGAGFPLSHVLTLAGLMEVGHYYSYHRYNVPGFREPTLAVVLSAFIYVAAFAGGALYALRSGWGVRMLAASCFVPALAVTLVLTTRASFFFTALIWFSSFFAVKVALSAGRWRLFSFRHLVFFGGLAVAAAFLYVVGQGLRWGTLGGDLPSKALPDLYSAFLGSSAAFGQWFDGHWDNWGSLGLGARVLAGPLSHFMPIHNSDFAPVYVGMGHSASDTTTVYTLFRELIEDFSSPGALAVLLGLGFGGGWSWRTAIAGNPVGVAGLTGFYLIALTSFVTFPFRFTTIDFAWGLFALLLMLEHHGSIIRQSDEALRKLTT